MWLHGLHDAGGEHLMAERPGWIVHTVALSETPDGGDYARYVQAGFANLVRLNWGYGSAGTIPARQGNLYMDFAARCARYVRLSSGCTRWIVGNEPNHTNEWPAGRSISPEDYADCYRLARSAIHAVQPQAEVLVAAIAPWNLQSGLDWLVYFRQVLDALQGELDGLTLHAYTHGADPRLVSSAAKMPAPYGDCHWHFRVYRDFLARVPPHLRRLPVYLTEFNQADQPWADVNTGYVQAVYQELVEWNAQTHTQKIHCACLYRWLDHDRWSIRHKPQVQADFRQAVAAGHRLVAPAGPTDEHHIYLPLIGSPPQVIDPPQPPPKPPAPFVWDERLSQRGVTLQPLISTDAPAWKLVVADYLDVTESEGKHHIYIEARDERGAALPGVRAEVINGGMALLTTDAEGKANFPMYAAGHAYRVRMAGRSDEVVGLGLGTPDDPMTGHHVSYVLVFQRAGDGREPAEDVQGEGVVNVALANLRSGPGLDYAVVATVTAGTRLRYRGRNGDWLQVQPGQWVYAPLLDPVVTVPAPPADDRWARSIAFVLRWEGELSLDPNDPGNYYQGKLIGTKYGISAAAWGGQVDIPNLTRAQAEQIYYQHYWLASGAHLEPWPTCLLLLDSVVLHGVPAVQRWLDEVGPNAYWFAARRLASYLDNPRFAHFGEAWLRRMIDLLQVMGASS